MIEGEGGSRYTVVHTGCIIPLAPDHCGRLQLSPAGRNISVWQDGIGWGHDPPTIIPVPLQSAFLQSVVARGPEELTNFLLKHSSFIRIPH